MALYDIPSYSGTTPTSLPGGSALPTTNWGSGSTWGGDFSIDTSGTFGSGPSFTGAKGGVLGTIANAIPGLSRVAGGIGDIITTSQGGTQQQSINTIKEWMGETLGQIREVYGRLADLTGLPTEEARGEYYKDFSDTMDKIYTQAREDLATDPRIDAPYDRLGGRIQDITKQYSLMRSPDYERAFKAPDAVAPINPEAIKGVMTLGPAYREQYSYTDPQTQSLIKGGKDSLAAYTAALSSSPDVQRLMSYNI